MVSFDGWEGIMVDGHPLFHVFGKKSVTSLRCKDLQ